MKSFSTSAIQNVLFFFYFRFLHLQEAKKEMPQLAILMKSKWWGWGDFSQQEAWDLWNYSKFCGIHMYIFLRSVHSFHQILKVPWPKKRPKPEGFLQLKAYLCMFLFKCSSALNWTHSPPNLLSSKLASPIKMNSPTSMEKVNGFCQIYSNYHLCIPISSMRFQAPRPETFASPSVILHKAQRNSPRLFTKPDLLKFLYKSKTAISLFTYIHMYRKDLVFLAFPAEAPASPESVAG